jgi:hypothetical protein
MKVIVMINGFETISGCEVEANGIKIFADNKEGNDKAKKLYDSRPFTIMSGGWRPFKMEVQE